MGNRDTFGRRVCEYDGGILYANTVECWLALLDEFDPLEKWMLSYIHGVRGQFGLHQVVEACETCGTLTLNVFFRAV